MSKKYTVKNFCKKYNDAKLDETKEAFVKSVMNINYIPYENKITICEKIIESSYYIKTNKNGIEVKKLHVNSPVKYMLYGLNLVKYYTNIEVNFKNVLEEFNMLNKCDLLDVIYSSIPEKELKEFRMLLDMVENDIIQNEYETHAFISNQVSRFGELIGVTLKPVMDNIVSTFANMTEEDVEKISKKIDMVLKKVK